MSEDEAPEWKRRLCEVIASLSAEEIAEAGRDVEGKERWHMRNDADKVAVQLQIGRGLKKATVAKAFGIGARTLDAWIDGGGWSSKLCEERRIALSRQVIAAGVYRRQNHEEVDMERLASLAEWRAIAPPRARPALRQDFGGFIDNGARVGVQQINTDNGNDGRDEADPHHDTRNYFRRRLDEIIAELNSRAAERTDGARVEDAAGGAGAAEDPGRG